MGVATFDLTELLPWLDRVLVPPPDKPRLMSYQEALNDLDSAVQAANKAFPAWAEMPIKERVQVFFKYRQLMEKHFDELAKLDLH